MDYKYIEQLLERYWECETTLQEEAILKAFFAQEDVPSHLLPYRSVFMAMDTYVDAHLNGDFDEKMLSLISEETDNKQTHTIKLQPMSFSRRFSPFYKAAACVAIILSVAMAASHSMGTSDDSVRQHQVAGTEDTYQSPDDVNNAKKNIVNEVSARLFGAETDTLMNENDARESRN